MAENKDKAKDSFKEWAIGSFHRFNKMTQSLGNMVADVQPPKFINRYVQSDGPNGEFLPLSWTREMLHRFASPPLSLQDIIQADTLDLKTQKEVIRIMLHRFVQLDEDLDKMFDYASPPSPGELSRITQSQTCTYDLKAIWDSQTVHLQNGILQADTPDSETTVAVPREMVLRCDHLSYFFGNMFTGDALPAVFICPFEESSSSDSKLKNDSQSLASEEAISETCTSHFEAKKTDTPDSEEMGGVLKLRFAGLDHSIDKMVVVAQPPVPTSPYEHSSSSDSELNNDSLPLPTAEAISSSICDTQPINLQNFVVKTDTPESEELRRILMLRSADVDQKLVNMVDEPLPPLRLSPYEESSSSDSELKSDSLSLPSEEAISETCTCDFEAISDTQPINIQIFVVQTHSPMPRFEQSDQNFDNFVDVPLPSVLITPYEESSSSDSELKNDSQSLPSEEANSQTCTCDFEAIGDTQPPEPNLQNFVVQAESAEPEEMGRISMLRLDGLDQGLDNLVDDPLPPLRMSPYEESGSSDSELKSDTISLPSEEAISETCTCDFKAMGDTQPSQNFVVQTESPESEELGRISMLRSAGLDHSIDNMVVVAQPPVSIPPYEESNSSDSELKNYSQSLPSEEAISQTSTSEFEAICDSHTVNLQNFAVETEYPDSETTQELGRVMPRLEQSHQHLDNLVDNPLPPIRIIPYEESSSSDSELKNDSLSLQSEEAISQTCTSGFEAMGDSQPDNLPNSNVQTDQPDSETMGEPLPKDLLVQANTSDLEAKVDAMSSTFEDAFTQTGTSDFKANLSYWYPCHPDGTTQTETPDSETMDCSVQTNTSDLEDDSMTLTLKVATAQADTPDFVAKEEVREVRDSSVQTITADSKEEESSPSLALQNKAKDLPVPPEVPQLFQEFLELQLQNVAKAVEIPEVVELMKLPKLLKGLNELELLAVLKILRTLDLPIVPNAMKVSRELLDVQQVLVDVSKALEVLEVHQVFDVPKDPQAEGSEVLNVLQKPKNMPKLLKRPIVAVVPTVRAVPGESQVARVMQSLDNCDNFEMTLLGKNGKKLLAFNFKKFL